MTPSTADPTRIALLGFTAFEQDSLRSFWRLRRRGPRYALRTDIDDADLIVADADDDALVAQLAGHGVLSRCLLVGSREREGAALMLPRPINPLLLTRALDTQPSRSVAPSAQVQRVLDELSRQVTASPTVLEQVLVVEPDERTLRFMTLQLERFGYETRLARSADEALEYVAKRRFEWVFVAQSVALLDAFSASGADGTPEAAGLCSRLREFSRDAERRPPCVVMLTRRERPLSREALARAGADACLAQPLAADELLRLMGDREVQRNAFVATADPTTLF